MITEEMLVVHTSRRSDLLRLAEAIDKAAQVKAEDVVYRR